MTLEKIEKILIEKQKTFSDIVEEREKFYNNYEGRFRRLVESTVKKNLRAAIVSEIDQVISSTTGSVSDRWHYESLSYNFYIDNMVVTKLREIVNEKKLQPLRSIRGVYNINYKKLSLRPNSTFEARIITEIIEDFKITTDFEELKKELKQNGITLRDRDLKISFIYVNLNLDDKFSKKTKEEVKVLKERVYGHTNEQREEKTKLVNYIFNNEKELEKMYINYILERILSPPGARQYIHINLGRFLEEVKTHLRLSQNFNIYGGMLESVSDDQNCYAKICKIQSKVFREIGKINKVQTIKSLNGFDIYLEKK